MINDKEFHYHMKTKLQPYEENQICLALFHGTGENVQLGPSEHRARHYPQNGLYRRYCFIKGKN